MKGIVRKDEKGNFIVVYHKECVEDSEAVVRVSCKLMPGFEHFKEEDSIEFELWEFTQEDGSFSSYARPYLTINPHTAKTLDTNEDGEADMGDKLAAMSKTLRSQIYYRITNDGSSFGCGVAMRNAENIGELFNDYAIEFVEWIGENTIIYNNRKFRMKTLTPVFLTSEELLERFKKEKGL